MAGVAIKISEDTAELVRQAAKAAKNRTMAGQVEHWARLAREIEDCATVSEVNAIKEAQGDLATIDNVELRERVAKIMNAFRGSSPATLRQKVGLDEQVVYEPDADHPGGVVRIEPDGKRTVGHLDGRTFVPVS